ncbi:type II CAAX endopeptidase family protein [Gryllotalpicola daejeonensis]|uniref:Type II CAAX endopeptidase family protein n=1 Tax=Gryllotalpicola daejeonensis TaxID=993087 RepID=A0ABP7ZJ00_9MICO
MTHVIRRHPLASFFTLAIAGSWLAWLPYALSQNGLGVWGFSFPALMGSTQLAGVLPGAYLGPIASAFVVTLIADGWPGVRQWRARLWRWRVSWRWYAVALLGAPLGLIVIGTAFSGGQVQAPSTLALAAYLPALLLQMVTTGLAEEPGWRDFALPRLQRRHSPLRASLLLGVVWGIWHLPLFLTEWGGWPAVSLLRVACFLGFCVAFSVVMTWLFNSTGESLPLAVIAHVSVNNFASIIWGDMFPTLNADVTMLAMFVAAALAGALLVVFTRGRLGRRMPAAEPALQVAVAA